MVNFLLTITGAIQPTSTNNTCKYQKENSYLPTFLPTVHADTEWWLIVCFLSKEGCMKPITQEYIKTYKKVCKAFWKQNNNKVFFYLFCWTVGKPSWTPSTYISIFVPITLVLLAVIITALVIIYRQKR